MHRFACLFVTACVGLGATASASAADKPHVAPVGKAPFTTAYDWTGLYVGVHFGTLNGEKDWVEVVGPIPGGHIHPQYSGRIGGGQIGFNYQIGPVVVGVEGDVSGTNADGVSGCISAPNLGCGVNLHRVKMYSGRAGLAWDRMLFYFKAGRAQVKEDYTVGIGSPFVFSQEHTRGGSMLGGGIEVALIPNWSVKLEYNQLDLGTDRIAFQTVLEDITQKVKIWKVGVNYKFDWGKAPVVAKY